MSWRQNGKWQQANNETLHRNRPVRNGLRRAGRRETVARRCRRHARLRHAEWGGCHRYGGGVRHCGRGCGGVSRPEDSAARVGAGDFKIRHGRFRGRCGLRLSATAESRSRNVAETSAHRFSRCVHLPRAVRRRERSGGVGHVRIEGFWPCAAHRLFNLRDRRGDGVHCGGGGRFHAGAVQRVRPAHEDIGCACKSSGEGRGCSYAFGVRAGIDADGCRCDSSASCGGEAREHGITRRALALAYVKAQPEISHLVFGVDNLVQLKEIVADFARGVPAEVVDGIAARFASVPADIFMPNKWRKGK